MIDLSENVCKVTVAVLNENDNRPEWPMPFVNLTLTEAQNITSPVLRLAAIDRDGNSLKYRLNRSDPTFSVSSTGDLYVVDVLDYEAKSHFQLVAFATDDLYESLPLQVDVFVLNVNDNHPYFLQSVINATVFENKAAGTLHLQFAAWDDDIQTSQDRSGYQESLTFSLKRQSVSMPFKIVRNGSFSYLTNSRALDYETDRCRYFILVTCTDAGGLSSKEPLTVIGICM